MDRLDAMQAFVAILDEGSLAAAGRRLRRSPAAMTRMLSALEEQVGAQLLHRTTRMLRPTAAGERYAAICRRVLTDLAETEFIADETQGVLRGVLAITAPALFGRLHVRPMADAFLDAHPAMRVTLLLLDRVVSLVEEGIDVAVRIGALPDSALIATKLGIVRRIACASPAYLARRGVPETPTELTTHDCIGFSGMSTGEGWRFGPGRNGRATRPVPVEPRLIVNGAEAAVASALEGRGVVRVLSYQVAAELGDGRLVRLLRDYEPAPLPVQIVYPQGRGVAAKTRAFIDLAAPRLRATLKALEAGLSSA